MIAGFGCLVGKFVAEVGDFLGETFGKFFDNEDVGVVARGVEQGLRIGLAVQDVGGQDPDGRGIRRGAAPTNRVSWLAMAATGRATAAVAVSQRRVTRSVTAEIAARDIR